MRSLIISGVLLTFVAGGAMAQTTSPPAQKGPGNSAINSSESTNRQVTNPVQGHNSFTEGEAKSRIEKSGFSNVSKLAKDDNGVWRGQAMKDGKQVDVSLDYQGNVVMSTGAGTTGVPVRGAAGR
jgi:hypothetical protein